MEETLKENKSSSHKEFEKLLSEDLSNRKLKEGEIITGVVSSIGKKHVFVDISAKSEGAIPIEEFVLTKEIDNVKVGSKIEVLLEKIENFSGDIVISREKARRVKTWQKMERAFEKKEDVKGIIVSRCKGGYVVDSESCLCFLPGSQIDLRPLKNFDHLMKTQQTFEVVKMDKRRGNIVLSRRSIMERIRDKDRDKIISKIKEGDIVTGTVKNLTEWGVFVDLNGVDALLHITDISWSRINKPSELLSISQSIKVKVTKIDPKSKKISVSVKHLTEDPYSKTINKYKVGGRYEAVVTKVQDYGCFAKLEEGLEGLIHQSELSWTKKNIHPGSVLSTSQKIEVELLEKDIEKRRLSLSYKKTLINPWIKFAQDHKVGDICDGVIKNVTDYALFVSIKNTELDGMIHKNEISYNPKDSDLDNYKKNQQIKFKILAIDQENEKIRLGIKQMSEDPFEFFDDKKVSDTITVVVSHTTQNGVYVTTGKKKLSVLIKQNQLAQDINNQRKSRFNKGDMVDCLITELDKEKRKVTLSIKALEEKLTREAVKRFGSKDSGGVLGDILGKALNIKKKKEK